MATGVGGKPVRKEEEEEGEGEEEEEEEEGYKWTELTTTQWRVEQGMRSSMKRITLQTSEPS